MVGSLIITYSISRDFYCSSASIDDDDRNRLNLSVNPDYLQ
jgi:hypothetical protein